MADILIRGMEMPHNCFNCSTKHHPALDVNSTKTENPYTRAVSEMLGMSCSTSFQYFTCKPGCWVFIAVL